jgi:class 3 adenylate cyclase
MIGALGEAMKQPVERRLAAILAADVAGYSRMMGQDEAGTAQALREHRAAADPLVAQRGGRIVKTTGDGVLIEFGSVVGAVQCAIALQRLTTEWNAGSPGDRRMEWRIGIHIGDVLVEDDDILGDGVNIAARLEGIAEPGGICISEDAFRQVRGKIEAEFTDIGEQSLKNRWLDAKEIKAVVDWWSITCLFYFNHIGSSGKLHNKAQVAAEAQLRQEEPR